MTLLVDELTCLDAWRAVSRAMCARNAPNMAVVRVSTSHQFDTQWLKDYCPSIVSPKAESLANVISTVFPYRLAQRSTDRAALYSQYQRLRLRLRLRQRANASWGTYFGRLISYGPSGVNQLEEAICKIATWPTLCQRIALAAHRSMWSR
jgi:hypothetical protein